jgi:hypothetical protein
MIKFLTLPSLAQLCFAIAEKIPFLDPTLDPPPQNNTYTTPDIQPPLNTTEQDATENSAQVSHSEPVLRPYIIPSAKDAHLTCKELLSRGVT